MSSSSAAVAVAEDLLQLIVEIIIDNSIKVKTALPWRREASMAS